jgi:hypothetical protein
MSNRTVIEDISGALKNRRFASITMWNRLEGRPRKDDFERALKAEIRDPLWMLTKQWQMGEFQGDDAGSPILAKLVVGTKRLMKYQLHDNEAKIYDNEIPLEGLAEQMPIPFSFENQPVSLDIRIMMGRRWLRMIRASFETALKYAVEYPVAVPDDADQKTYASVLAHPESFQKFAAAENRRLDGYEFYNYLKKGGNATDNITGVDATEIDSEAERYVSWVEHFFLQPSIAGENAYIPSRLEYQFKCSAPDGEKEKVYEAEEYYSGRLDWFNLSVNDAIDNLHVSEPGNVNDGPETPVEIEPDNIISTFIPTTISYDGMPDTRWWKFEDRKTYLGDIKPDTTDISKLLFMEFTLLYANDWCLIPQTLPYGTISNIKGLVVTNVFGERTWIEPTGKGQDDNWHRWTMFTINRKGKDIIQADNSLLLLPTVPKIQEGPVLEQVALIRDEVANMVWAIETDILLPSGDRKKGTEAGRELFAFYKRLTGDSELITDEGKTADIRYCIMNSVPENWIPFIPVHLMNDNREIQLQRASMPRILPGNEGPEAVKPRTSLLRYGLDEIPKTPFYVYEEEVPRAGINIVKTFQRTRWYNGKIFIWLGIRKQTGRGEGSSGLRFDYLINQK